ncbi:MAG TPA: DUF4097 family beta strand repeat-containing protein [Thermoanaerobaculia bacterium]|nr:DUF4097 family beta strand repeat-containing protein [Thermoanaerobaculia bacterium]
MTRYHRKPALVAAFVCLFAAGATAAAAETTTKAFRRGFAAAPEGRTLRLANLAGRIELVPVQGHEVVVETTVHAEGRDAAETRKLLDGMQWVKEHDKKGREEWVLTYPVDDYDGFAYPRKGHQVEILGIDFGHTSATYRGERVRVYASRRSSAPILYANLRIGMPQNARLAVRNVVGAVRGGALQGTLAVDTGSGDVQLASFAGGLVVDTGSGDVTLGNTRGETSVDTGSGDVTVDRWIGNGSVDTGSGDVTIAQVSAGKLSVDTGSGDVTVKAGHVSTLSADTGSGSIRVLGVEVEELAADTGSGDVTVESSLAKARSISVDTGSGDVSVLAGPGASFEMSASQGSGEVRVGYGDAQLRKDGRKVVGAWRGDGRTKIRCETGSGDCSIGPKG